MKFRFFLLNFLLSTSLLFASDHLRREQQHNEMEGAFYKSKRLETLQGEEISDGDEIFSTKKNEEDTIFIEQSDIIRQSFSSASDILVEQNRVLQQAQKNIPSSLPLMTMEDFQHIKKVASQTIFHQINDTLNYLLTSKSVIKSSLAKNPDLIHFTLFNLIGHNKDEVYEAFYPLQSINHPVADLAHSYLILGNYQHWIDTLYFIKKAIFPTSSIGFYDHNKAVAMKEIVGKAVPNFSYEIETIAQIKSKIPHSSTRSYTEASLFMNTHENFCFVLQNLMRNLAEVLPDSTVSIIPVRQGKISSKKARNLFGKDTYNQVMGTLLKDIDYLDAFWLQNIRGIFSIIRSHAIVDGLEKFSSHDQNILQNLGFFAEAIRTKNQTPASYQQLFSEVTNNIREIQKIRKRMGLPSEIFDGDDIEKEFLNALQRYENSKKIVIEEINHTNTTLLPENSENTLDEVEVSVSPLKETKIETMSSTPKDTVVDEEEIPMHDEDFVYDKDYFKGIHDYHQKLKQREKKTSKQQQQGTFSDYEIGLYGFINDTIYHPVHRPTWDALVSGLVHFGFVGEPNRAGNGSTWVFSVTDRNELFYNNDYRQATFNVHEFKGNEPIHPKYLKFFQSGLGNVFGLTEEYITEALKKHAAQTKKN